MQCFMKKEAKSLRCRKCCNYRRKVLPSELTSTIEQFIVYVHRNEAYFTYIPMNSRLTTFTKNPPPNVTSPIIFWLFLFCSGAPPMTRLTAGALTDPQLPPTASNVCTTDAMLGDVGRVAPQTKILATPVTLYIPTCVYVCVLRMCVCVYLCMCVCLNVCMYVIMYVRTYVRIACTYVRMYVYA